ncbi:dolichyl-diphosphooligosaccharide--protein glycosyltransferase subunit 1B isoform X2 [Magnolia sinica]|uniref:dolichyl-diphosphooligosaccharide--protein glycosyltransferase subunit 1B isoform X2 n=1 Tax=Magnolia sinica TaxID=86752 RepID=UPI002657CD49|nr:dolichyl-diphosphooligosaccharide--protein glycosyltransferase subunit 1B isoform X2 [Magnolia sinica]
MEGLMTARRATVILVIFSSILSFIQTSSSQQIQILTAERRIDLTSHIVRVYLTLKVENIGTSPAAEILLAFPPTQAEHLALIKAASIEGKRKKRTIVPLDVNPTELPDTPNGAQLFSVSLQKPLNTGETVTLEVLLILTHSLEPFPTEIGQSDSQLVYYRDSAIILSPYNIIEQTTYVKTPSTKLESYTRVDPTNRAGTELKYGRYDDRSPYSFSPIIVHFENNHPFAVVEELERELEVSHWGSLQITERYKLVHAGAKHKGVFSRVEYQSRPSVSGVSSFKNLLARLPPRVHSVYYRDEIGNISTSHLRADSQKVVLPEGSKDPFSVAPFTVEQSLERSYSYLDVVGRHVVVLKKENIVPEHTIPFQVYYKFNPIFMLAEPLMLVSVFFLLFVACIAYLHIDLSIRKS